MDLFNLFAPKSNASAPRSPGSCQGVFHRSTAAMPVHPPVSSLCHFPSQPPHTCVYLRATDILTEVVSLKVRFFLSPWAAASTFFLRRGVCLATLRQNPTRI